MFKYSCKLDVDKHICMYHTYDKYGPIEDWNASKTTDMSNLLENDALIGLRTDERAQNASRQKVQEATSRVPPKHS